MIGVLGVKHSEPCQIQEHLEAIEWFISYLNQLPFKKECFTVQEIPT